MCIFLNINDPNKNFIQYQLNKSHQARLLIHSGMATSKEEDPPYIYKGGSEEAVSKDVEKVIIDPSVTTIEEKAFDGCTSLASIDIPEGVMSIDKRAFQGCTSLVSIVIPDSVMTIGDSAFEQCTSLASIVVPDSFIMTIGDRAFEQCTSLSSIVIPKGIASIGKYAFYGCTSLASIVIPDSVTTIGERAFQGCTSVPSIMIPDNVMTIGNGTFEQCTSLVLIVIPERVTTIGNYAFYGCTTLASTVIPDSVTAIGRSAFSGCTSLASIVIPDSTTIGEYAFSGCIPLERWAAAASQGVPEWLKTRFDDRPLHKACYRSDITKEKITKCLDPTSAKVLDSLELSALQVLLMNEKVTQEMVDVSLKAHPDAVKDAGPLLGMYPLHLASNNPRAPLEVFESLRNTHTKDGRLVLMVADENNYLPCALAIRNGRSDDIILHLFEYHAIQANNLRTNQGKERLKSIYGQYVQNLSNLPDDFSFDPLQQHGWVSFVSGIEDRSKSSTKCARLIAKEWPIEVVRRLAYYKDLQGRIAIESATKQIRAALEKRLLFLGRFEIAKGPPLHKSPTSLLVKAIDRRAEVEYRKAFEMAVKEEESPNKHGKFLGEKGFNILLDTLGIGGNKESFKEIFGRWDLDVMGKSRKKSVSNFSGLS